MQTCPHCNTQFDWNNSESGHQVNDYFELTFCSYECSQLHTFNYMRANKETLRLDDFNLLIETV